MEVNVCNNGRSNVLLLLLFVILTTSSALPIAVAKEEKVKLNLYYESLCPGCQDFILKNLSKIFHNDLISIVDLKLSPYGNAELNSSTGTIDCQHGPLECGLNTVEACAIHAWPAVRDHFPIINCVEKFASKEKYDEWKTCLKLRKLDPKPVSDCIASGLGHKLALQYDAEINALEPPHDFVPWVVVDGKPLEEDYDKFMSYICKAYKGSHLPKACHELSLEVNTRKPSNEVCYKEEDGTKSKSTLSETIAATAASSKHHVGMTEIM